MCNFCSSFASGRCLELLGGGLWLLPQCSGQRRCVAIIYTVWRHRGPRADLRELPLYQVSTILELIIVFPHHRCKYFGVLCTLFQFITSVLICFAISLVISQVCLARACRASCLPTWFFPQLGHLAVGAGAQPTARTAYGPDPHPRRYAASE